MWVGNDRAKNLLTRLAQAEPFPHVLIVGPSGHGKTSLVRMAAANRHLVEVNANAIEDSNDLYAFISQAKNRSVLFLDEVHGLSARLQESLYEAMESGIFQRTSGRGQQKTFQNIKLPPVSFVAATTKENKLNPAFKNRFLTIQLQPYRYDELVEVARDRLPQDVDYAVPHILTAHCRSTPRTLIKICAAFSSMGCKTVPDAMQLLESLDIHADGLNSTEVRILNILKQAPLSINSLAAKLMLEEDVVQEEHEPYLIQKGFIDRGKSGRFLTTKGIEYLSVPKFASLQ